MTDTPEMVERVARAMYGIPEAKRRDSPLKEWTDLSPECRAQMLDRARGTLDALEEAGYVVVPREPRGPMLDAGEKFFPEHEEQPSVAAARALCVWQAMIKAALDGK